MMRRRPEANEDEKVIGRLVAVALFGFVLFVPPLLSQFNHVGRVLGVPILWAYLFVAWLTVIGLVAVIIRRSG